MQINAQLTDEAVLTELGGRLARWRLEHNLSQLQLGENAGVGSRTVQRLEMGHSVQLSSLIRVLRATGLLEALDRLVPEPAPSPIERLQRAGKERRRAGRPRTGASDEEATPWTWGDEHREP